MGAAGNRFIPFGSKEYLEDVGGIPSSNSKTVYIIDDMAEGLRFISSALDQAGYRAILYESFSEFAREFQEEGAVAILIDVRLGEEDATDVLEFLRRHGTSASLYLMSGDLTALANARRFAEEIGLNVVDIIAKPFTGKQIVEQLQQQRTALGDIFEQIDVVTAMQKGWIYPVLQPKLDLRSGKIKSAELLSRMTHPVFGIVSPQRFIGHMDAQQSQTLFMQNVAFVRRHFEFDPSRGNDLCVSVNVDPVNLAEARRQLRQIATGAPNLFRNLMFEITEEAMANLSDEQVKLLFKLNLDGARLSIDDFGSGHSNFARLSRLPLAEIKIDRSIVHGCSLARPREIMVKSIIGMAHDLGVRVVAEGVETRDDFNCLDQAGCDEVQGFLVGRPMRLDRFEKFVKAFNEGHRITSE